MSGDLALTSDYRFRGVTLNDQKPAPQASVQYDGQGGAYGGLFVSDARLVEGGDNPQALAYAGWARRCGVGCSWDVGIQESVFAGARRFDYGEAFFGLTGERYSARVYVSPDYFGLDERTLYVELNGSQALGARLDLIEHVGVLHGGGTPRTATRPGGTGIDGRLGVSVRRGDSTAQLAWIASLRNRSNYPDYVDGRSHAVTLTLTYAY